MCPQPLGNAAVQPFLRLFQGSLKHIYGDFQFATDDTRDSFLRRGVFSCYQPVASETPLTENPTRFHPDDWARLTRYSHTNNRLAFEVYTTRYLETSGQIYWSDSQLSAAYVDNYHADLDRVMGARVKGSEMITEIYVERSSLAAFMERARDVLRAHRANVIYGTVRLIEKDDETFLAWARDRSTIPAKCSRATGIDTTARCLPSLAGAERMGDLHSISIALGLFSVLMLLRVAGQLFVHLRAPRWLPPMASWQSGLVPYPFLLATQAVVLVLMFWITTDFARGSGVWVDPLPRLGRIVLVWSYLYAAAMVIRYGVRMARKPDQRWLGGTIPIIFHSCWPHSNGPLPSTTPTQLKTPSPIVSAGKRDLGARLDRQPEHIGVALEIGKEIAARHEDRQRRWKRQAWQSREMPAGVQDQAVIQPSPRVADLVTALEDAVLYAGPRQLTRTGQSRWPCADDNGLVRNSHRVLRYSINARRFSFVRIRGHIS